MSVLCSLAGMEMFGDEGRDVRIIQHILAEACVVMKSEGCSWTVTFSYRKWVRVGRIFHLTHDRAH